MFIRLSHKIESVVAKHQKVSLCLGCVAFFILLTVIAYFMPNVAIIIFGIIFVITGLLLFTADGLQTCDYNVVKSWISLLVTLFILIIVLAMELKIFHGWEFLKW